MKRSIWSGLTYLLLLTFLITPISTAQAAAPELKTAEIPTLLTPKGIEYVVPIAYKWLVVAGATKYQVQVYRGAVLIDNNTITLAACGATICTYTPGIAYPFADYRWHARAMLGGVWKSWSAYLAFTVTPVPTSFNSQFNGSMAGWARRTGGTWSVSSTAMFTNGLADKCSSAYRTTSMGYGNFDYSARVRRIGGSTSTYFPDQYLAVRMGTKERPDACWYSGYLFGYTNGGQYAIWKMRSDGAVISLQPFTTTGFIVPNNWNVLRVIAQGSQFNFYINGHLIKTVTDIAYSRGYVGFEQFNHGTVSTTFLVDWAKLTVLP